MPWLPWEQEHVPGASAPHFSAHVCWSWHNAIPVPSASIPSPPSLSSPTSLLSQAPGAASILLTHYLSLLKDNPCQGFLGNPIASSLPDQVPSLLQPPLCPRLSTLGSPRMMPHQLCSPRAATTFSPADPLIPSQAQAPLPSSPQNTHLCNSTASSSTCPPQPGSSSHSYPPPSPSPGLGLSLWSREPRREALVSSRTSCSHMLQAGASIPEEALFRFRWRLLPGDNDLLVPV